METGVQVDQGDNEPIAHKRREVEEEEDIEEDYIKLEITGETQKDELRHGAVILIGGALHSSTANRNGPSGTS
jgi:hypothetical protein